MRLGKREKIVEVEPLWLPAPLSTPEPEPARREQPQPQPEPVLVPAGK